MYHYILYWNFIMYSVYTIHTMYFVYNIVALYYVYNVYSSIMVSYQTQRHILGRLGFHGNLQTVGFNTHSLHGGSGFNGGS
jgi:hypothetical protein